MCQARADFGLAILTASLLAACIGASAGCSGKTPLAPDGAGADAGTTTTAESPQTASDVAVEAAPALAGEAGEAGLAIHSEELQAPATASYTSPLSQGCIRQFYDASFYGWLPLYLPELFPTRVRATGQGFGFNFGRILAAVGVLQVPVLMGDPPDYARACSWHDAHDC